MTYQKTWDKRAIDGTLEYLRGRATDEFLMLENGATQVHEAFTDAPVTAVAAVQKSLFALLVGVAADRGIVCVDEPMNKYLPPGWTKLAADAEQRLTLKHLLTMTTGMDDALAPLGEIGVSWRYNSTAYNYLKRVLIEQTGKTLQAITDEWICEPLGLTQTQWKDREDILPDGRYFTALEMNGLDMAKLGSLVLANGEWGGKRLISEAYWHDMLTPGSEANPAWCYMWWRNDSAHFMTPFIDRTFERAVIPEAPPELIFTQGNKENRIYVDPTTNRVIVRRGELAVRKGERHNFDRELWRLMNTIWSNE